MGSGGSTARSQKPLTPETETNSGPKILRVIDRKARPLPDLYGKVVVPQRLPKVLPPPPEEDTNGRYVWFVEDLDHPGEWEAYTADACERLDAAWRSGQQECLVLSKKRVYTVDLLTMEQRAGSCTARPRSVKRVKAEEGTMPLRERRYVAIDPFLESDQNDGVEEMETGEDDGAFVHEDAAHLPTLLRSVKAHNNSTFTAEFSPNGSTLLTGSVGKMLHWDLETSTVLTEFTGFARIFLDAVYSPNGSRILCGTDQKNAILYNTNSPVEENVFAGHTHKVYAVGFLAGEGRIATASMDCTVRCWDVERNVCLESIACHTKPIFTMKTSKVSDWLAITGGDDNILCAHDFRLGGDSVTSRFIGHTKTLWTCAFRSDEQQFASGGIDTSVRVWDMRRPEASLMEVNHHMRPVHAVEYMPNDKGLLSCGRDSTVRFTDTRTGDPVWRVLAHVGNVFRVRYNAKAKAFVTCGSDSSVNIWHYSNPHNW